MLTTILATSLLAAPSPLAPAPAAAQEASATLSQEDLERLFPGAKAGMVLEVDEEGLSSTYADLVRRYGELTGQVITYDADTETLLRNGRVRLDRTLEVAAKDVPTAIESFLVRDGWVLTAAHAGDTKILHVASMMGQYRSLARAGALFIEPEDLPFAEQHPATLFSVAIQLDHLDPRQLANSLRTLIVDANTQQILPAGNSKGLILVGFGDKVAGLARSLRMLDAAAAGSAEERTPVIEVIELAHADARNMARVLRATLGLSDPFMAEKGAGAPDPVTLRVVEDERTNVVVIRGTPREVSEVKALAATLDRPAPTGKGKTK